MSSPNCEHVCEANDKYIACIALNRNPRLPTKVASTKSADCSGDLSPGNVGLALHGNITHSVADVL